MSVLSFYCSRECWIKCKYGWKWCILYIFPWLWQGCSTVSSVISLLLHLKLWPYDQIHMCTFIYIFIYICSYLVCFFLYQLIIMSFFVGFLCMFRLVNMCCVQMVWDVHRRSQGVQWVHPQTKSWLRLWRRWSCLWRMKRCWLGDRQAAWQWNMTERERDRLVSPSVIAILTLNPWTTGKQGWQKEDANKTIFPVGVLWFIAFLRIVYTVANCEWVSEQSLTVPLDS